jgi:DNA-binding MarR family transcriptional regulator
MRSEELTPAPAEGLRADANLGYLFRLAHQRFRALLEEAVADLGMSAQDYGILSVFENRQELSTSELARISQVTRQTMHTSILGLEAAGLLERRAMNLRVVLVRPTKLGRRRLGLATSRVRSVERRALLSLGREDQRTVREWLANLAVMTPRAGGPGQRKDKS